MDSRKITTSNKKFLFMKFFWDVDIKLLFPITENPAEGNPYQMNFEDTPP